MANLGTTNLGNSFNTVNIANTNATKAKLENLGFSEAVNKERYKDFSNTILLSAPQIKTTDSLDPSVYEKNDSGYYSLLVTDGDNKICDFTYINAINNEAFYIDSDDETGKKELNPNTEYLSTVSHVDGKFNPLNTYAYSKPGKNYTSGGEIFNDYDNNNAEGKYSHAEGYQTSSNGKYSHAEGYQTSSNGQYSHAEGCQVKTVGSYSHAEGCQTTASGDYSHVEGYNSVTSANYSHAEGYGTTVSGTCSHTEGYQTIVNTNANNSHAEGHKTVTNANNSHAEGNVTYICSNGTESHAEGYGTYVFDRGGHAEGEFGVASGKFSHVEGIGWRRLIVKKDNGNASYDVNCESSEITSYFLKPNSYVYDEQSLQIFKMLSAVESSNNTATVTFDRPLINTDKLYLTNHALGNGSHSEGLQTHAFGDYSHSEGINTYSGDMGAHAEGYLTRAVGRYSHAEGSITYAVGNSSHVGGNHSVTNKNNSFAHGDYLLTENENEAAFGKYNVSNSNQNQLFSVGVGTSETNRQNIFQITNERIGMKVNPDDIIISETMSCNDLNNADNIENVSLTDIIKKIAKQVIIDDLANTSESTNNALNEHINKAMPVGSIIMWYGTVLPDGWLECNGTSFSQTTYPKLYQTLGNKTSLPNLSGKFPLGVSSKYQLGDKGGGKETVTLSIDNLPSHNHKWFGDDQLASFTAVWGGSVSKDYPAYDATSSLSNKYSSKVYNTSSTGSNSSFSIMPPYLPVKFIIKAK